MLLCQDTKSEKKIKQDYDRKGLRTPPVEILRYKCKSFRYAATVVWNRLQLGVRESVCIETCKARLRTFYFNKWLVE